MGGDLAPEAPVKGALKALRQYPHLTIILAGILDEITPFLDSYEDVKDRLILEEEPEIITNHESPVMGVRKKVNSATVQGMLKVRSGEADGFVSAGSTGATLAGGMFRLGRIPGIERPALAPLMPNGRGHFLLIDCGANVDCKPEYLVQFGIMGDAYMRTVRGLEVPRIGLVNIGAESEKGNALTKAAYPLMEKAPFNGKTVAVIGSGPAGMTAAFTLARKGYGVTIFEEKDRIGEWKPERMENGETRPQVMARSRHIILMHKSKWNAQQQARAAILFRMFPRLEEAYNIYLELVDIFNKKSKPAEARMNLARWYNKVEAFNDGVFSKVIETFENHNATIINYFEDRLTNASAESFNAKIKAFRTQFRGVGDIKFFMYRLATLYS